MSRDDIESVSSFEAAKTEDDDTQSQHKEPLGHLHAKISSLSTRVKKLESSIAQQVADKIEDSVAKLMADAFEERIPKLLSDILNQIIKDSVKQALPKFDKRVQVTLKAYLVYLIWDLVILIDSSLACTKAAPKGENKSTQTNNEPEIPVPAIREQSSDQAPSFSNVLVVYSSEEEPPVKKLKFMMPDFNIPSPMPDFTIPSPTPLNFIMPQGIRLPFADKGKSIVTKKDPKKQLMSLIEQGGSTSKILNLKQFSVSGEGQMTIEEVKAQMEEIKILEFLKAEKEKSERRLKVLTPEELKAKADQLAAYEAKRAKMLEEYNHYITFRADPLPITKISYMVNNSTKEASMRIIRNNQPLNITVYDRSSFVSSQKLPPLLGILPPPQLTAFGLTSLEKKKKRSAEILKEVFVKEDIVVDGMHWNLVPPSGVVPS
ncbi:hypothetical protein Tco_0289813 [Tanacetum coccineum]